MLMQPSVSGRHQREHRSRRQETTDDIRELLGYVADQPRQICPKHEAINLVKRRDVVELCLRARWLQHKGGSKARVQITPLGALHLASLLN
ncbi:MAG: hypothetical protein A2788_00660 [Candidatus Abawacabacteria bacterium RIFCSPHIGHO2_01_FULL_46_8]|uniref:Uncharacterized protein n=1 Tax=Candidatus Abawacabacteria bacterium RIFCSPHIGHO2_01_FULL_46_8 TaxID=1817815 RepID=A0A1F4XLQ1_9BACT|nr:MAG: hypothetical protein A2788_00660 [Candidatus Abawacabacteria bacterium RIFCSPHIGHO2_01_FULL_46_8]